MNLGQFICGLFDSHGPDRNKPVCRNCGRVKFVSIEEQRRQWGEDCGEHLNDWPEHLKG